jgi:hypothetical protein
MCGQSARDEERDRQRDRDQDREREEERERERQKGRERERERERMREKERERERNQESGGVRGGDSGGYRRDDKGQKDGGRRDARRIHRDCFYGDSRGTEKSPDFLLKRTLNIDINKQIMGAQGASKLCTDRRARSRFQPCQRGDSLSKTSAEPARRRTSRGRGASTAGARGGGPAHDGSIRGATCGKHPAYHGRKSLPPLGPVSLPRARTEGGGGGGHLQSAERG